ncbi:hypothetical protein H4R24_003033 [Coemansia sp. RSA 988]|nr:hypothetical protein H4R24_003033 [Coemansia sp. RSA 988]
MASVLAKLHALVSATSSDSRLPLPVTLSASPEPDKSAAACNDLHVKESEGVPKTTIVVSLADDSKLAESSLQPPSQPQQQQLLTHGWRRGRTRRPTDATVNSISTTGSNDTTESMAAMWGAPAAASGHSRQETERLLQRRMRDLELVSRLHPVSKVLQQSQWDCGLACVCMVLRAFGQPTCTVTRLEHQLQTQSPWTIDLAFLLLQNLGQIDFTYYTTYAGVNPDHLQRSFYSEELDADQSRVLRLFARTRISQDVRVVELEIPLIDLERFLVHRQYVAMLLVDNSALRCVACIAAKKAGSKEKKHAARRGGTKSAESSPPLHNTSKASSGMFSWLARWRQADGAGFLGHYILLIGFIPSLDMFMYRDPGIPEEFCLATAETIDTARRRPGTDADCIILKI